MSDFMDAPIGTVKVSRNKTPGVANARKKAVKAHRERTAATGRRIEAMLKAEPAIALEAIQAITRESVVQVLSRLLIAELKAMHTR